MKLRLVAKIAAVFAVVAFGGCAGGGAPRFGGAGLMPALSQAQPNSPIADAKVKITGTYRGSIHVYEGGKEHSGTITIKLTQSGKKVSGTATVYAGSKSAELTITGTVKSQSKKRARFAFEACPKKGRCGTGTATVTRAKVSGKITVSKPPASITFTAKREPNEL